MSHGGIDHAVSLIKRVGHNSFMAKTDLRSAFRVVSVNSLDYEILGFTRHGKIYFNRCLSMGGSSSCQIFEALSTVDC